MLTWYLREKYDVLLKNALEKNGFRVPIIITIFFRQGFNM